MSDMKKSRPFGLLCVTSRKLCRGDFLARVEEMAACRPTGIVLREKDLDEGAYQELARQAAALCRAKGTRLILHGHAAIARELGMDAIHLPLPLLRRMKPQDLLPFRMIGASCHSPEEAREAEALGCTYITAGHVFPTGCKPGLPPRGLGFLREVAAQAHVPVYAIGGVTAAHIPELLATGASGACVMSGWMECKDVAAYMARMDAARNSADVSPG